MTTAPAQMRIQVEGLGAVHARLQELDRTVKVRTLKTATRSACKVILTTLRRTAPRGTGLLRRSMGMNVRVRGAQVTARVGQKQDFRAKKGAKKGSNINRRGYAVPIHMVERGTKPHMIKPTAGKLLAWSKGKGRKAQTTFARSVQHPGLKPMAILDQARRASQRPAAEAWYEAVRKELADLPELP
jgi:hypothetical protein